MKDKARICPVSGMFLDEPEMGSEIWVLDAANKAHDKCYLGDQFYKNCWDVGNCFATREDAERYAKHLKAMAKLRRLGGIVAVRLRNESCARASMPYIEWKLQEDNGYDNTALLQLTTEEQQALLWPNEEK